MRWLFTGLLGLLLTSNALAATPTSATAVAVSFPYTGSAAEAPEFTVQTGTLVFSQGDCLAVKVFTRSPYTHVAAVVVRDGEAFAYESTNGVGVRCMPLERYLSTLAGEEVFLAQPQRPLTEDEQKAFRSHLDRELGRPYSVTHHLSGNRADGLHCAEYITDALMAADILHAKQPPRVSPASLALSIKRNSRYGSLTAVNIPAEPPATVAEDASWCERMWFDTKSCTIACCEKLSGWFLCR